MECNSWQSIAVVRSCFFKVNAEANIFAEKIMNGMNNQSLWIYVLLVFIVSAYYNEHKMMVAFITKEVIYEEIS